MNKKKDSCAIAQLSKLVKSLKDLPAYLTAFISKYETYLRQGIGLVVVDVVTVRQANLHGELLVRLTEGKASSIKVNLYTVA